MIADFAYLIDLAVAKACEDISRDMKITESDRIGIANAVINIVRSGYGTRANGTADLHEIVAASIIRYQSLPTLPERFE